MEEIRKCYKQKFNKNWYSDSELGIWIEEPDDNSHTAFCKYCKCYLSGSKSIMLRHGQTPKHKQGLEHAERQALARAQQELTHKGKPKMTNKESKNSLLVPKKRLNMDTVRNAEMRLCAYVAEQNLPLTIMDTLPGLLKALDPDSEVLQHIQCSHTKTGYLMKNALADDTLNSLSKKLQSNFFSLIIEDAQKFLTLIARYYNEEIRDVEDSFLNILDVENSWNSMEVFQAIMSFLGRIEVPVSNLLALSQYNSSTCTDPPSQRLIELNQYVYVPGCVYDSFHLCASEACKELPTPLEDLCNDIFKFTQKKKPTKRVPELKRIQNIFNVNFRNSQKLSNTNRISICKVVERIVENWDSLLSYFETSARTTVEDREEKAETILQTLRNPIIKAYFLFLNFFLPSTKNLTHESLNTNNCLPALLSSLEDQLKTILKYYMQPIYVDQTPISSLNPEENRYFLQLDEMYFGPDVVTLKHELDPMFYNDFHDFQVRCLNFYVEFCRQLLKRVDFTDDVLKNLIMLSPKKCKCDYFRTIIPLAKLFPNLADENIFEQLDREWRFIKSSGTLSGELDFISFWNKVFEQKYDISESRPKYPHITKFVKAMLCLPHTSGATEKIMAGVNMHNLKSKLRTKRETPMINSLLLTKEKIKRSSAKDFEITEGLMELAKSANKKMRCLPDDKLG
ncbi:hypothetical protein M8J77_012627 [Diaphorina citri]|nr:hypothetical protein M8J77_012627 [Diaphorina citri]